ncbi:thiamine pyrophosphate-dependent enzyme [Salsuginibacillus kocurii]|uniref:thiamine pyrophosphate-dependent enzyme n=1 Tax=Salsuginibacillus kocurii TaxID=427078 RepID=UPI000377EB27|nr:thiamine pyrophosphate-dependent enzyme [Salsuginibacillus kocurii]
MEMTAAKAIVEVMQREGVEKAFCVPGESYLDVLDELYCHSSIEVISGRHEGGVSFMTEGYAKSSGKVGVCMATRGPGATNLSIGLHTAYQDSTPVVAFVGQVERQFRNREGFQEIDLAGYFNHILKWSIEIDDASRVPELVHRAFHTARTGRPGPVLVSLPQDVLSEVAEMQFQAHEIYDNPSPHPAAIAKTKELLEAASKPVIIAGGGVTLTKSASSLTQLAETLNIPVLTSFRRYDAFPNQHQNYTGTLGLGSKKYVIDMVQEADLVIAVGTRFSQTMTQDYTLLTPDTKLIHVDISSEEINKVYSPTVGIVADAKAFIETLLEELPADLVVPPERTQFAQEARKNYEGIATPREKYDDQFVNLEGLIYDFNQILPEDTVITSDAGNFFGWLSRFYQFKTEGTYVGPTSGAMGYGLPAAIGSKIAQPDKPVVAFCGDGGLMMTVQELETAVRYKIPIIVIVANNNMYGTIRMHQEIKFPSRVVGTSLNNPNFAEMMELMGGYGESIESNKEFSKALERAMESNMPALIELKTDPDQVTVDKAISTLHQT